MIIPKTLVPGDTIAIIPTARAISRDELSDGIALAGSWGLKVVLGDGVGRKDNQQAGSASERAADLQAVLENDDVKAVWCARGGYGTVQLLEYLDLAVLRKNPKWLIGFSDVTVLHSALHAIGVSSLHAQMPFNIREKTPVCMESLKAALFNAPTPVSYTVPPGTFPMRRGTAEGVLIGGNISVLISLRGTPVDLDPAGKILFLEDLDELLYHLDRMVMNLKLGGWFSKLAGLVVGGVTDMHDKDPRDPFGQNAEAIIARALQGTDYPVCFGFPAGHIADNRALVLGQNAKLSVTHEGASLSFGPEWSIA
ncbi:MAG: LD-carboxypeptidase [Flavobacteriales bacterium]|nr:LD-carboxypeptidase [Flavobacteriales bacterium]